MVQPAVSKQCIHVAEISTVQHLSVLDLVSPGDAKDATNTAAVKDAPLLLHLLLLGTCSPSLATVE